MGNRVTNEIVGWCGVCPVPLGIENGVRCCLDWKDCSNYASGERISEVVQSGRAGPEVLAEEEVGTIYPWIRYFVVRKCGGHVKSSTS
jgi:hypothetical protein